MTADEKQEKLQQALGLGLQAAALFKTAQRMRNAGNTAGAALIDQQATALLEQATGLLNEVIDNNS